ncbi:hypothetical protein PG994_003100 [Apiospora phragmitis]|uniref:Rhodopsin domain-containing protein n=1 Tax=Apiospora phragmitis TaxID=2905665 RepID=A0ABR1WAV9_9PEZI
MSDPSKKGVLALCGSMRGLSTIAVGLRLWARKGHKVPLMADDWTAILALVRYSSSDMAPEEIAANIGIQHGSEIALDFLTTCTLGSVKLSALFFYRRIFCNMEKRGIFNIIIWVTVIVVVLWLFIFLFLPGFQCGTHFSALYDGTYNQYCKISLSIAYGLATSDFLLDVWILALPIPHLTKVTPISDSATSYHIAEETIHHGGFPTDFGVTEPLRISSDSMTNSQYSGLAASTIRMASYINFVIGGPDYLFNTDYNGKIDSFAWDEALITGTFFYTMLECGMALVAVNLPLLRVLAISLKASELMSSVKGIFEFSFLRGSSSQIEHHDLEAPRADGMKRSFSTGPSERTEAAGAPSARIPLHVLEGSRR